MRIDQILRIAMTTAVLLPLAGCAGQDQMAPGAAPGCGPATSPDPVAPQSVVTASGHGWTGGGLDGPIPAPCACHTRTTVEGQPLPDPGCTPGAIDTAVNDQNITTTVCRTGGYTSSVCPPVSLTGPAKRQLLAAYGISASQTSDYDLDHLIPLNAGGASDVRNLWPIPNQRIQFPEATSYHNDKAVVEYYTFTAICQHQTTVSAVRTAMATDWTTAVQQLGLPPIPTGYTG